MDIQSLPVFVPNAGNEVSGHFKNVPVWLKYTITVSGANLVVTASDGSQSTVALAAALTQDVLLDALPARAYIARAMFKASVAFTGTATLTGGLGVAGGDDFYIAKTFDLKAAVAPTNYTFADEAHTGLPSTTAPINLLFALVATTNNLTLLTAGSVDVWILISQLP